MCCKMSPLEELLCKRFETAEQVCRALHSQLQDEMQNMTRECTLKIEELKKEMEVKANSIRKESEEAIAKHTERCAFLWVLLMVITRNVAIVPVADTLLRWNALPSYVDLFLPELAKKDQVLLKHLLGEDCLRIETSSIRTDMQVKVDGSGERIGKVETSGTKYELDEEMDSKLDLPKEYLPFCDWDTYFVANVQSDAMTWIPGDCAAQGSSYVDVYVLIPITSRENESESDDECLEPDGKRKRRNSWNTIVYHTIDQNKTKHAYLDYSPRYGE